MGIPFIPLRGAVDSDYMRVRPDFRLVDDPYHPGEKTVVAPALQPDFALLHGFRGDRFGNAILNGGQDSRLTALAARSTIVTVEEIVDGPLVAAPGEVFVSGIHVGAIVHSPMGAHPSACRGYYLEDTAALQGYVDATETPERLLAWLERFGGGTASEEAYLVNAGVLDPAGD